MFRIASVLLLASAALLGCDYNAEQQRFRGLMVIGPHGPEFYPETDFRSSPSELYPWRVEGQEPEFGDGIGKAEQLSSEMGLPRFNWIKVEFLGKEVQVSPNGHGATQQVLVENGLPSTLVKPRRVTALAYDCFPPQSGHQLRPALPSRFSNSRLMPSP